MSLDLDWSLLDGELAAGLLVRLNRSLSKAPRPDFIGPISLTSLDFGDDPPEVRLTQVGDVWRQFSDAASRVAGPPNVETSGTNAGGRGPYTKANAGVSTNTAGPFRSSAAPAYEPLDDDEDIEPDFLGHLHPEAPGVEGRGSAQALPYRNRRPQPAGEHLAKFAEQSLPFTGPGVVGPRLQTFRQYTPSDIQQVHGGGSVASFPASIPHWANGSGSISGSGLTTPAWGAGLGARALIPGGHPSGTSGYFSPWHAPTPPTPSGGGPPLYGGGGRPQYWQQRSSLSFAPTHAGFSSTRDGRSPPAWAAEETDSPANEPSSTPAVPSLQLQLSVVWSTNTLKLGISTSLLVNHPTPAFMELPLNVSVIGLGVQAGVVVAFEEGEGKGRKVHISLVEDQEDEDEEAETGDTNIGADDVDDIAAVTTSSVTNVAGGAAQVASKHPPGSSTNGIAGSLGVGTSGQQRRRSSVSPLAQSRRHSQTTSQQQQQSQQPQVTPPPPPLPPQRPLTVGERLLPHITLESSVGQADKHVLRNVGKVEKFIVDLLRRAVEDELVWPNFYTLALPSS